MGFLVHRIWLRKESLSYSLYHRNLKNQKSKSDKKRVDWDFPGGPVIKNLPSHVRDRDSILD